MPEGYETYRMLCCREWNGRAEAHRSSNIWAWADRDCTTQRCIHGTNCTYSEVGRRCVPAGKKRKAAIYAESEQGTGPVCAVWLCARGCWLVARHSNCSRYAFSFETLVHSCTSVSNRRLRSLSWSGDEAAVSRRAKRALLADVCCCLDRVPEGRTSLSSPRRLGIRCIITGRVTLSVNYLRNGVRCPPGFVPV